MNIKGYTRRRYIVPFPRHMHAASG